MDKIAALKKELFECKTYEEYIAAGGRDKFREIGDDKEACDYYLSLLPKLKGQKKHPKIAY